MRKLRDFTLPRADVDRKGEIVLERVLNFLKESPTLIII
jgi:hypothetical protein